MENNMTKDQFLEKHIFHGLTNLNNGFDAPSIFYFSEPDFQTVLERVREAGIGIYGVSPWKDGAYYDAAVCEDYGDTSPLDPDWYFSASEDFKATGETLQIENHPI